MGGHWGARLSHAHSPEMFQLVAASAGFCVPEAHSLSHSQRCVQLPDLSSERHAGELFHQNPVCSPRVQECPPRRYGEVPCFIRERKNGPCQSNVGFQRGKRQLHCCDEGLILTRRTETCCSSPGSAGPLSFGMQGIISSGV